MLVANVPLSMSEDATVSIDETVLLFSLAMSIVTGVGFGLVPAFRLSAGQLAGSLARGHQHVGSRLTRRGGRLIITIEVALAVVLLLGAALTIQTFAKTVSVDLGFDRAGIVTVEVAPINTRPALHSEYYPALIAALKQLPAIDAVGAVDYLPLMDAVSFISVRVPGGQVQMIQSRCSRTTSRRWASRSAAAAR
jgi:putative ABC transport system permease protein